ncbi:MAG: hypothetical protein JSR97_10155 [Verrucomicrobia bacterium]|nr:hypothetical protein [Verrucomicrobiota bacterium]
MIYTPDFFGIILLIIFFQNRNEVKHPIIKLLYHGSIIFPNEINQPMKRIGLLTGIACSLIISQLSEAQGLKKIILNSIVPFGFFIFLTGLCKFIIFVFIKRSGGRFIEYLGNNFKLDNKRLEVLPDTLKNSWTFAKKEDSTILAGVNEEAYSNTCWYVAKHLKENQFKEHIEKNGQSVLLVKHDIYTSTGIAQDMIIGYTHVIPVNIYTFYKFKSGKIKEIDFLEESVVSIDFGKGHRYEDDTPFGLIVFSVSVNENKKIVNKGTDRNSEKKGKLLAEAIAFHLHSFLKKEFKYQKIIPVVFQTTSSKTSSILKYHITNSKEYSKEHGRIMTVELFNPLAEKYFLFKNYFD